MFLMEALGADTEAVNSSGKDCLQIAKDAGHSFFAEVVKKNA